MLNKIMYKGEVFKHLPEKVQVTTGGYQYDVYAPIYTPIHDYYDLQFYYPIIGKNGENYIALTDRNEMIEIPIDICKEIGGVLSRLLNHLYQCFSSLFRKWVRVC